ncbi:MAG: ABC transporter substrate-binding protein [Rhodospirillales bacterium]|nr:ABC transporter substrate-binding protein [Rhodospirillales bacterium]
MRLPACLCLAVFACCQAMAEPVTIENCGRELVFDAPPERAVIADLNMTEMAFALGLQPSMVGVTGLTGWYKVSPEFMDELGDIPELAPKYPSLENLLAAEPDFFMSGWYYGMEPGGEVTPDTLEPYGVTTFVLTESCIHVDDDRPVASMDLLYDDMIALGLIFDRSDEAEALVADWRRRIDAIAEATAGREPLRVFLYDSGEERPFTSGRYAIPNAMIGAAGGVNVMADMDTSWGRTSWETVAVRDPEFLILLDYEDDAGYLARLDFLKQHPAMSQTRAVINERFVPLRYAELTPGPANVEAIEKLARAMYPDAF